MAGLRRRAIRSARSRGRSAISCLLNATLRGNVGSRPGEEESRKGASPALRGRRGQLAAVPALVFLGALVAAAAFGAGCFGGSARMPPQGSLAALASGIF